MANRFLPCLVLIIASCAKPPEPAPEVVPSGPIVASLKKHKYRVTYRRSQALIWNSVFPGVDFFERDAVQTHNQSLALLEYQSGSKLLMGENSQVIITLSQGDVDEALLRNGDVTAESKRDLWLLTYRSLFKLRPNTELEVKVKKKVEAKIKRGQGTVVFEDQTGKIVSRDLKEPFSVEVDHKAKQKSESWYADLLKRLTTYQVPDRPPPKKKITRVPRKKKKKPKVDPVKLYIARPPNHFSTFEKSVRLSGKLSKSGAKLFVSGKEVKVGKDLRFERKVALKRGMNKFLFQLIQKNGESSFLEWNVVRKN